jgi:hypothetical protein
MSKRARRSRSHVVVDLDAQIDAWFAIDRCTTHVTLPMLDGTGRFNDEIAEIPLLAPLKTLFLTAWTMAGYTAHAFVPGMHPRSLLRADLAQLAPDTLVSAKSDGLRMQLCVYKPHGMPTTLALVDRSFRVHILVPEQRQHMAHSLAHQIDERDWTAAQESLLELMCQPALASLEGTVLDGELMFVDENPLTLMQIGRQRPVEATVARERSGAAQWIAHDAVWVRNTALHRVPFERRLRVLATVANHLLQLPQHHLQFATKPWAPLRDIMNPPQTSQHTHAPDAGSPPSYGPILADSPRSDGLILAAPLGLLQNGIAPDNTLFKWKPHHSIDLYVTESGIYCGDHDRILRLDGAQPDLGYCRNVQVDWPAVHHPQPTPGIEYTFQEMTEMADVWEASVHQTAPNHLRITLDKQRTDKVTANDVRVVRATLINALENIQRHELYAPQTPA